MTQYDDKLCHLQQQLARKKRIEAELNDLHGQVAALSERERELKAQKAAEQADVDRLEGRSLAAFFYNVVGKRDERLDKERQEAYAAAVKYDSAARELAGAREDIERREAELTELSGCERRYTELLREKTAALKASGSSAAAEILQLEERISNLENQKREICEAIEAGETALGTTESILESLDSAEGWGTWDLLGGGLISDLAKHSHLDEAQSQVEQLQSELRRFKTELADVTIQADMQLSIDGFLRFADYFFDGLFADWAVLDRIGRSKSQAYDTLSQIEDTMAKLRSMYAAAVQEQAELKKELAELVTKAEL